MQSQNCPNHVFRGTLKSKQCIRRLFLNLYFKTDKGGRSVILKIFVFSSFGRFYICSGKTVNSELLTFRT